MGEYKDDRVHGQGVITYSEGGKYVGEFKDGIEVGGWHYLPDGSKKCGYKDSNEEWVYKPEP